ncbi:MAG TPA: hypothetical protein V6D17_16000 [Candidatus Obscuribacterales bacterium]
MPQSVCQIIANNSHYRTGKLYSRLSGKSITERLPMSGNTILDSATKASSLSNPNLMVRGKGAELAKVKSTKSFTRKAFHREINLRVDAGSIMQLTGSLPPLIINQDLPKFSIRFSIK